MEKLLQDLRYAIRQLRRSMGFTLVAVLTLALGIGATTAIFSVIDASVLRPLPFPEPDRLVRVWETNPAGMDFTASDPNYLDFRAQNRTFAEMAAYKQADVTLTGEGRPERLEGMAVTHTLFPLLGMTPMLGRSFTALEDRPGGDTRVAVLSHDLWQRRFGSDPDVVGRKITLDGRPYSVIGIMGSDAELPGELPDADLWVPLAPDPNWDRGDHWLDVIGRLGPGATLAQAQADLSGIARRIGEQHPHIDGWGVRLATFPEWIVGPQFRQTIFMLFAAVGLLLLMACVNLANLLFARATTRQMEIGIRAALGAGRTRLVRQLLTESVLIALLGSGIGLLIAFWAIEALRVLEPAGFPRLSEVGIDGRVLGFAVGLGLLTSLVFGLAPAMRASRADLTEMLKQGGRGGASGRHRRVRDALVVAQVAMAMVLLVGAGLLIRSFLRLQQVDPGFDAENALAVPLQLPDAERYSEPWQKVAFFNDVISRIEAIPGVVSAAATTTDPFSGWQFVNDVTPEERAAEVGPSGYLQAHWRVATPGFFQTMGIPLLQGRVFSEADRWDGPRLAVITETLARRLWPNDDPIGKGLFWGGTDGTPITVVGVVGDYRDVELAVDPPPTMFLPYNQIPWPVMTIVVRTAGDVSGIAAAVRQQIWAADPDLPVPEVRPLDRNLSEAVAGPRFRTLLLGAFSAVALVLAMVGIYGVIAFAVVQRTREIGVRIALGARPERMAGMLLRRGAYLTLIGVALGCAGAWALTRFLGGLLYETAPTDVATFATTSLLLGSVALLATYLPARRATRVDPMIALRAE